MGKIRILVAHSSVFFRQGLKVLFAAEHDMEVVGEASNGRDAVDKSGEARPDVVLMDVGMPGGDLSIFEATRQIKQNRPETKVLFLTLNDDEDYLVEGIQVGANGYVLIGAPVDEFARAVRGVALGGSYLGQRMLSHLFDLIQRTGNDRIRPAEKRVVQMLAEGKSVKEIAQKLFLSDKTIKAQKYRVMQRLNVHTTRELVEYAIRKKLIRAPSTT